jgi:predicted RNA-binding Zn-ribbon protein involved in translation (DUF1610 family)
MTARITTNDCHLYRVTDTVQGKFYIGKHAGRIQQGYWGSGKRIRRHIKKYGRQNLKYEILVIADEQYILDLERRYVTDEFIKANPNCLNLCKGGMGGNLGNKPWNKGLVLPKTSEMMSQIHKGNTYRLGKKHSAESIQKMIQIHSNRVKTPLSDAGRQAIIKANTGRKYGMLTCPNCGKTGGLTAMPRWHFDNCKHKGQMSCLV